MILGKTSFGNKVSQTSTSYAATNTVKSYNSILLPYHSSRGYQRTLDTHSNVNVYE